MTAEYLILLLCLCATSLIMGEISCRNEAGDPVDWLVVYKLPKYRINQSDGTGLEYLYLDSTLQDWQVSKFLTNMTQSALGQVMQQLYQFYKDNDTAYMMYNDCPPDANYTEKLGHTKGVLLFNQQQGFWLSHSIPHFPPFPEHGFGYPDTGRFYGQNAFCMTFKFNQFKQIAAQLLYYNPYVYNCSIPIPFQDSLSNLNRICQGQIFPRIDRIRLAVLKSAGGESFLNFAKSKYLVDDIITGWMAQGLERDLLAETWLYKDWKLPSNCSLPWHVYNIERVSLASLSFYSRYDHSKWCVSRVYREGWICIGDLNRSPGQSWRSGGFICTQNKVMFSAFRKMVVYYEYCKAQAFTKE